MSDSLRSHGLQHARLPCLSLSPRVCSHSYPLWHLTNHLILCCRPLLLLPSVFPNISWIFMSGGQNSGASASASVLPMNIQGCFPLGLTGLISLQSKGLSRVFSNTIVQKHQFFGAQPSLWSNSHIHTWLLKKTIALTVWTFVGKVMSLLFNRLSRFVTVFLPRNKCLLISLLQQPSTVILEPKKIKSVTVSIVLPSICHEVMRPDATILVIWTLSFQSAFFTLHFHLHQEAL